MTEIDELVAWNNKRAVHYSDEAARAWRGATSGEAARMLEGLSAQHSATADRLEAEHKRAEAAEENLAALVAAVVELAPVTVEDVVSTVKLEQAWRDGYFAGKRDYAGSITGGVSISTPNPYSPEGSDQ